MNNNTNQNRIAVLGQDVVHKNCSTLLTLSCLIYWLVTSIKCLGFPGGVVVKNPPANAGDLSSVPGLGRPPEVGNSHLLQYSSLEISWTKESSGLHGVSGVRYSWAHTHTHTHTLDLLDTICHISCMFYFWLPFISINDAFVTKMLIFI